MAFKKKIRGKMSTYYYVDFWVGTIHINKSTGRSIYGEAMVVEAELRAAAEELYLTQIEDVQEALTLKQAIDYTYKERWSRTETGERSVVQANRLAAMLGYGKVSELSGKRGMLAIQNVRDKLLEEVGETTVDRHLSALKTVLKQVGDDLEPEGFVMPKIKLFNKSNRRERTLSKAEEKALFTIMGKINFDVGELFMVMLDTGLRLGEALQIRYVYHISLDEQRINLTGKITKNGKPRSIPLSERAYMILRKNWKNGTEIAFPFQIRTCQRVFSKVRAYMGLSNDKDFVPHMLRHTLTSRLLNAGAPKWKVQALLGHSDVKMTTWYHHFSDEQLKGVMELLND